MPSLPSPQALAALATSAGPPPPHLASFSAASASHPYPSQQIPRSSSMQQPPHPQPQPPQQPAEALPPSMAQRPPSDQQGGASADQDTAAMFAKAFSEMPEVCVGSVHMLVCGGSAVALSFCLNNGVNLRFYQRYIVLVPSIA
jgi:hypothetical protein